MSQDPKLGARLVGEIFKKAATIGAKGYVTAEDTLQKTLSAAQFPKELILESIKDFFKDYKIHIEADVSFKPRNPPVNSQEESEHAKES